MIARAPIAAGAIAAGRSRLPPIGADFVVPGAAFGMAALDRRAVRAAHSNRAAVADDVEQAFGVAPSVAALGANDPQRVIRIG